MWCTLVIVELGGEDFIGVSGLFEQRLEFELLIGKQEMLLLIA